MATGLEIAQAKVDAALAKLAELAAESRAIAAERENLKAQIAAQSDAVLEGASRDPSQALNRVAIEGQIAACNARLARLAEQTEAVRVLELAQAESKRRFLQQDVATLKSNIKSAEQVLASGILDSEIANARLAVQMRELNRATFISDTMGMYQRLADAAGSEEAQALAQKHKRTLP
ncbi:MAG TPA: hypothetical protein VL334_19730 [Anaerolineae bacterium]|nr:hypothetical protein [Anaerolineae bacterium]